MLLAVGTTIYLLTNLLIKGAQMNTNDFDFDLPEELIAQTPLEKRDASKALDPRSKNRAIPRPSF